MANSHLDNYHCFKGMGQAYWRSRAIGLQPLGSVPGSQGHQMVYAKDPDDGFALQNGGIANPSIQILPARALIRFMAAGRTGKSGLKGNWWLDLDTYSVLSHFALNQGITLAKSAQTLLVVPQEWSDCGQMIIARPKVTLMAYFGKGKAVALVNGRSTSVDARRLPGTRLYDTLPGTNIEQIFVPGERQFLSDWFSLISTHRADLGGGAFPPL